MIGDFLESKYLSEYGVKERETNDVNNVNGLKVLLGSHE